MSKRGVKLAAEVFNFMQLKRQELLSLVKTGEAHTVDAHQDILLSRLFEAANDYIKDDFSLIVMMDEKNKFPKGLKAIIEGQARQEPRR